MFLHLAESRGFRAFLGIKCVTLLSYTFGYRGILLARVVAIASAASASPSGASRTRAATPIIFSIETTVAYQYTVVHIPAGALREGILQHTTALTVHSQFGTNSEFHSIIRQ